MTIHTLLMHLSTCLPVHVTNTFFQLFSYILEKSYYAFGLKVTKLVFQMIYKKFRINFAYPLTLIGPSPT